VPLIKTTKAPDFPLAPRAVEQRCHPVRQDFQYVRLRTMVSEVELSLSPCVQGAKKGGETSNIC